MALQYSRPVLVGVMVGVVILLAMVELGSTQGVGVPVPSEEREDVPPVPTLYEEESEDKQNTTGTPCVNMAQDCEDWAMLGECWKNPSYMVKYCSAACWSCPQVHDCTDVYETRCPVWAALDQCRNNSDFMRKNCFRSCGLCRQASYLNQTASNATLQSRPPLMPSQGEATVEPPAPIASPLPKKEVSTVSSTASQGEGSRAPTQSEGGSSSTTKASAATVSEKVATIDREGVSDRSLASTTMAPPTRKLPPKASSTTPILDDKVSSAPVQELSTRMESAASTPSSTIPREGIPSPSQMTPSRATPSPQSSTGTTPSTKTTSNSSVNILAKSSTNVSPLHTSPTPESLQTTKREKGEAVLTPAVSKITEPDGVSKTMVSELPSSTSMLGSTTNLKSTQLSTVGERLSPRSSTTLKEAFNTTTAPITTETATPDTVVKISSLPTSMPTMADKSTDEIITSTSSVSDVRENKTSTTTPMKITTVTTPTIFTTIPTQTTTMEIKYDDFSSKASMSSSSTSSTTTSTTISPSGGTSKIVTTEKITTPSTSTVDESFDNITTKPKISSTKSMSTSSKTERVSSTTSLFGISKTPSVVLPSAYITQSNVSSTIGRTTSTSTMTEPSKSTTSSTKMTRPVSTASTAQPTKSTLASTLMTTTQQRYECSNAWTSDADCNNWAFIGECFLNYQWMRKNCLQACGFCSEYAECVDGFPDSDSCPYWASQEECAKNPTWMKNNCFRSCGYCGELEPSVTPSMMFNLSTVPDVNDTGDAITSSPVKVTPYSKSSFEASNQNASTTGNDFETLTSGMSTRRKDIVMTSISPEMQTSEVTVNNVESIVLTGILTTADYEIDSENIASSTPASITYVHQQLTGSNISSHGQQVTQSRLAVTQTEIPTKTSVAELTLSDMNCFNRWDSDADCIKWAIRGECTINNVWMSYNCTKACRLCGDDQSPTKDHESVAITSSQTTATSPPFASSAAKSQQPIEYDIPSQSKQASTNTQKPNIPDVPTGMVVTQTELPTKTSLEELTFPDMQCFNRWDSDADCIKWAFVGECTLNDVWMSYNCTKACGFCIEDWSPSNEHESVAFTSTIGNRAGGIGKTATSSSEEMVGEAIYVSEIVHTDAAADVQNHNDATTPMTLVNTTSTSRSSQTTEAYSSSQFCLNRWLSDHDCEKWALSRECETSPVWMAYNCTKSCGLCDDGMLFHTRPSTPGQEDRSSRRIYIAIECINTWHSDTDCEEWADGEECTSNPEWMSSNCQKACSLCYADSLGPTTVKPQSGVSDTRNDPNTEVTTWNDIDRHNHLVSTEAPTGIQSSTLTSLAINNDITDEIGDMVISTIGPILPSNNLPTIVVTKASTPLTTSPILVNPPRVLSETVTNASVAPSTALPFTKGSPSTSVAADILNTMQTTVANTAILPSTVTPEPEKSTVTTIMPTTIKKHLSDVYISNETHILMYDGSSVKTVISQVYGSIIALAIDVKRNLLFWSDMGHSTKGIYRATLTGQNITRIISRDVLEVNGLTLDYSSGHVYWTDAQRRRIEVADYDGTNRRILISEDLEAPRSIVADPLHGYLFWGDQGTRRIERSLLDGTQRRTLVGDGLIWPNQLAIDFSSSNNKLLYVDGWNKTLSSIRIDGSDRPQKIADLSNFTGDNPIFGLALGEGFAYVSVWGTGTVVKVPLDQKSEPVPVLKGLTNDCLFSLASTDARGQPDSLNPCSWETYGGCSHLCLPTGVFTNRCACPSAGGLVIKDKTCVAPTEILLYADASTGEVSFIDPEALVREDYLVGRSSRPVAVGYDPVDKYVYWSDVKERSIHRSFLNGTGHQVMLNASHGLGFVDGLFVDWIHRKLYFTNMDFVTIDSTAFTWHRVEVVNLDGTGRRSVVTDVEQPRGIWVDMTLGYLYYTDWGQDARVVRTQLDGSEPVVIRDGLENPNGLVVTEDAIYVIDSEAKGREAGRDGAGGSLFRWDKYNEDWTELSVILHTPFGISTKDNKLFITDWGRQALWSYDVTSGETFPLLLNAKELMGVFFTQVDQELPQTDRDPCTSSPCSDVCFESVRGESHCSCSSYDALVQGSTGDCTEPANFVLIADMSEIRMVAQSPPDGHVYTVVSGNRYASSYSALVWDGKRNKFYFSDVNKRVIYQSDLSGDYRLLYDAGDVVDGMVIVDDDYLYWTAQEEGAIYRLNLDQPEVNASAIVMGLSQPKALVFAPETRIIFWTEVGINGSVKKSGLNGQDVAELWTSSEIPEALFLDARQKWIGFSIHGSNHVYTCLLSSENCSLSTMLSQKRGVASNVVVSGDYMYYSDWDLGSIVRVDFKGFTRAVEVIKGLTRPTSFAIISKSGLNDVCPQDHMCSDLCVTLPIDYACACFDGRILLSDGLGCYDSPQSTVFPKSTTPLSPTPTMSTILGSSKSSTVSRSTIEDGISSTRGASTPKSTDSTTIDGVLSSSSIKLASTEASSSTSIGTREASGSTGMPSIRVSSSTMFITSSTPTTTRTSEGIIISEKTPSISSSTYLSSTETSTPTTVIESTTPTRTKSTLRSTTEMPSTSTSTTDTMPTSTTETSTIRTTSQASTSISSSSHSTTETTASTIITTLPPSTSQSTTTMPSTSSSTVASTTKMTVPSTTSTTRTKIATITTVPLKTTESTATIVQSTSTKETTISSTSTQATTTTTSSVLTASASPLSTRSSSTVLPTGIPTSSTKLSTMPSTASSILSTPETSSMSLYPTKDSQTISFSPPIPLSNKTIASNISTTTSSFSTKSLQNGTVISPAYSLSSTHSPIFNVTRRPRTTRTTTHKQTTPQTTFPTSTATTPIPKQTSHTTTKSTTTHTTGNIMTMTSHKTKTPLKTTSTTSHTSVPPTTPSTTITKPLLSASSSTNTPTTTSTKTIPKTTSYSAMSSTTTQTTTLKTTSPMTSTHTTTRPTTTPAKTKPTTIIPTTMPTTTIPKITDPTTTAPTATLTTTTHTTTPITTPTATLPTTTTTTTQTTTTPTTPMTTTSTTMPTTTPTKTTTEITSTTTTQTTTPITKTTQTTTIPTSPLTTTHTTVPTTTQTTTTQTTTAQTTPTTMTQTTTTPTTPITAAPTTIPTTTPVKTTTITTPRTTTPITTTTPKTTTTTKITTTPIITTIPTTTPTTTPLTTIPTTTPTPTTLKTSTTTPTALTTKTISSSTKITVKLPSTTTTSTTLMVQPTTARRTPIPATGPRFTFCPANRTVFIERGSEEPVVVWWTEPKAINAEGSIIRTVKVNRQPGAKFRQGTTLITYTATDKGQKAKCDFFVHVINREFSCANTPAPLNGMMDCRVEEFVYTCQMKCKSGYVPSSDLISVKHFCRTTGWQPEFPANYSSQSCLKSKPLQQMMPVIIDYSGPCRDRFNSSFEEAFVTKLAWRFRQLGLCPLAEGDVSYGLCEQTNYKLSCDTSLAGRKKRQVERVKVNVTVGVPESTAGSPQTGQLQQMRANIEQLVLAEQLNINLDGQEYLAQQVEPPVPEVIGCPPGHSQIDNMCLLCPVGSFLDGETGRCIACSPGYYQPAPGSYSCDRCPKDTVTEEGAFSSRQCSKKPTGPIPTEASLKSSDSLSVPIVIGLSVAAGIVFIITITLFICTVRKIFKSKGKMKLDQEKALMNGNNHMRYSNPAFVARPLEETANLKDPTPRYLAVTKMPPNGDGVPMQVVQQPVQYRRLPSGQVVRVVPVPVPANTSSKARIPPVKSRKYDMKHQPQVLAVPVNQPSQQQGMYRKYQPGQSTGWQSLSASDKLTQ